MESMMSATSRVFRLGLGAILGLSASAVVAQDSGESAASAPSKAASALSRGWELDPETKRGEFEVRPYLPVFILPLSYRADMNATPSTPNPANQAPVTPLDTQHTEIKFQISLKTKVAENLLGTQIDWWAAYSQQSFWQAYASNNSSPFRETDYMPETWITVPMKVGPAGFRLEMLNVGFVHQSNGQTNPLSRSWNRIYALLGFSSGNLAVVVRPWWRVPESAETDNNPDILDYVGRMEAKAFYAWKGNVVSLSLRNNLRLRGNTPNRTSVAADWSFPIKNHLHGYVQAFSGWGDSLQNYNFHNCGIGAGVSIVSW